MPQACGTRSSTRTEVERGGVLRVDGDEVELRPARYVFVAAGSRRRPVAGPDGLSFVAVGARPQDGWEPDF